MEVSEGDLVAKGWFQGSIRAIDTYGVLENNGFASVFSSIAPWSPSVDILVGIDVTYPKIRLNQGLGGLLEYDLIVDEAVLMFSSFTSYWNFGVTNAETSISKDAQSEGIEVILNYGSTSFIFPEYDDSIEFDCEQEGEAMGCDAEEIKELSCNDGINNDRDSEGYDCNDPDCADDVVCNWFEDCYTQDVDDDNDGAVDCDDLYCVYYDTDCQPCGEISNIPVPPCIDQIYVQPPKGVPPEVEGGLPCSDFRGFSLTQPFGSRPRCVLHSDADPLDPDALYCCTPE
jgi:hypothetical protein